MTAHAAQGHAVSKGAIVDLNIGGSSSAIPSYVALARVERRTDLLIRFGYGIDLPKSLRRPINDVII